MAPRFDTGLLFTTVDALIRSSKPQTDTALVSSKDPLQMYFPKALLIEMLSKTVTTMNASVRKAAKSGLLSDEDLADMRGEIERRKAYVKQLRDDKSMSDVYMSMHPISELGVDEQEEDHSWN